MCYALHMLPSVILTTSYYLEFMSIVSIKELNYKDFVCPAQDNTTCKWRNHNLKLTLMTL